MSQVTVVVPYRGDGGGPRDRAWTHVRAWYESRHPGWQIVQGLCQPGPWCKAAAVADALQQTTGDILIVADADVVCEGVAQAVDAVRAGWLWAMPHRTVHRLTPDATDRVLAGGPLPPTPEERRRLRAPNRRPRPWTAPDIDEVYTGLVGGGLVVLPRALYEQVPLDPRFHGFGGEDGSWGRALRVLSPTVDLHRGSASGGLSSGAPWRGRDPLWHLWHPPQPRLTRAVGSLESQALARRYRSATTPAAMRALLAEIPAVDR